MRSFYLLFFFLQLIFFGFSNTAYGFFSSDEEASEASIEVRDPLSAKAEKCNCPAIGNGADCSSECRIFCRSEGNTIQEAREKVEEKCQELLPDKIVYSKEVSYGVNSLLSMLGDVANEVDKVFRSPPGTIGRTGKCKNCSKEKSTAKKVCPRCKDCASCSVDHSVYNESEPTESIPNSCKAVGEIKFEHTVSEEKKRQSKGRGRTKEKLCGTTQRGRIRAQLMNYSKYLIRGTSDAGQKLWRKCPCSFYAGSTIKIDSDKCEGTVWISVKCGHKKTKESKLAVNLVHKQEVACGE